METQLIPPVRYHGSKTLLAPRIVALLGDHRCYVEPFAGSAAVLLAKPPVAHEVLNDLDDDVVNFFAVLRDRPDDVEAACALTPYARSEFYAVRDGTLPPTTDPVERARRWFVRTTQAFGASTDQGSGWSTSTRKTTNPARSTRNKIARFAAVAERLAGVQIDCRPAVQVIELHDGPDTVFYCDPPYVTATRTSRGYACEMTDDDHRELAATLHATTGRVVLSGYRGQLYDELFAGWPTIEFNVRAANAARTGEAAARTEVIWMNFDPPADRLFE